MISIIPKYGIHRPLWWSVFTLICIFGRFFTASADSVDTPKPSSFAFVAETAATADAPMYRIELPEHLYRNISRPDLGDIRIFNRKDEIVPHELRQPPAVSPEPKRSPAPFFPIYESSNLPDNPSVYFKTDADGTIFRTSPPSPHTSTGVPSAYLVDLSGFEITPQRLALAWSGSQEKFIASVSVETSGDMTAWRQLIPRVTLAELRYGDHLLTRNTIQLPQTAGPYLRISHPGDTAFRIREIIAEIIVETESGDKNRAQAQWLEISATSTAESAYEYDTGGFFPADSLNLHLGGNNTMMRARLFSKSAPGDDWRVAGQHLFYRLAVDGETLTNPPLNIRIRNHRYWRVEPDMDETLPNTPMPTLQLRWTPDHLVFLASGEPPFYLAYGYAGLTPPQKTVNALLAAVGDGTTDTLIQPARLLPAIEKRGKEAMAPLPEPLPWKAVLLWTVLVLGVILVGWMAFRLHQQMNGAT